MIEITLNSHSVYLSMLLFLTTSAFLVLLKCMCCLVWQEKFHIFCMPATLWFHTKNTTTKKQDIFLKYFWSFESLSYTGSLTFQVLDRNTIPMLDTKIVCGATSLPVSAEEDLELLMHNKILYVTDVVPNRMVSTSYTLDTSYSIIIGTLADWLRHLFSVPLIIYMFTISLRNDLQLCRFTFICISMFCILNDVFEHIKVKF